MINCYVKPEKKQELFAEKHPDKDFFGRILCPCCNKYLHGHGWRKRLFLSDLCTICFIWMHRLKCPKCKKTYTIMPQFLAPLKHFSLETIKKVITFRIENGHCTKEFNVPIKLQKIWYKQFLKRSKTFTNFPNLLESLESNAQEMTSSIKVKFLTTASEIRHFFERCTKAHHRLGFFKVGAFP